MDMRAYMFRPGWIQPLHGERSRTGWYRTMYALDVVAVSADSQGGAQARDHDARRWAGRCSAVVRLDGRGPHILHSPDINRLGAD